MTYTAMFAHLESKPIYSIGDPISKGVQIGRMGDTGQSVGAHLHLAVVEGEYADIWHLRDMEDGLVIPSPRELNYFIDIGLFQYDFKITTPYCDYEYQNKRGKVHHAYDVSTTKNWPWNIYWNRSFKGWVTLNTFDKAYGNTILIAYKK
jgi:murein DD-endopeptidase MepM/ murein hydrolase activator NlpD